MPSATEYLVEVSAAPGGRTIRSWWGRRAATTRCPRKRRRRRSRVDNSTAVAAVPHPSAIGRRGSGWFNRRLTDLDGGRLTTGRKPVDVANVRSGRRVLLAASRARRRLNTHVSSPQSCGSNTGPFPLPRPIITLQLQKPDGTRIPLKSEKYARATG